MDMHLLISYAVLYIAAKIGKKLLEKIRNPVVQKCLKYAEDPIGEYAVAPIREYVVTRIINYLLAPIGCLLCYNRNIKDLRTQLGKLRNIRDEVQGLVDAAERNGEVVLPRVQKWQKSATEITQDPMNLLVNRPQLNLDLLVNKPRLNLMVLSQQSKSAKEKRSEVDQLIQKGSSFDRVSTFRSRIFAMEKIMEALKDDQTSRTGIYGASGVGKTTLVKEIGEEAKDGNLFDEVVMAKVSSDPNLERIQCEIADMLGLRFDENNDAGRARRLFQRLEGKKRILIILDDIWEKVDLEAIGIPYDGCKIVLVSRSQDVCHQSGAEKYFPIEALSEDEGWKLFRRIVGDSVDSHDLHPKPAEVAERCAGSPMAIVIAARAFKKRGNSSEVAKLSEVFKVIHPPMPSVDKPSYDHSIGSSTYQNPGGGSEQILASNYSMADYQKLLRGEHIHDESASSPPMPWVDNPKSHDHPHSMGRSTNQNPGGGGLSTRCNRCGQIWASNNSMANYQKLLRGEHIHDESASSPPMPWVDNPKSHDHPHSIGRSTYQNPGGGGLSTRCNRCGQIWASNNSMANYQKLLRGEHIHDESSLPVLHPRNPSLQQHPSNTIVVSGGSSRPSEDINFKATGTKADLQEQRDTKAADTSRTIF